MGSGCRSGRRPSWRSGIAGLLLAAALPDPAAAADPFQPAPGPEAPEARPHRRPAAPRRETAPDLPAPAAIPAPPPAAVPQRAPGQTSRGAFDGTYRGRFSAAGSNFAGAGGGGRAGHCPPGGPAVMIVQGSGVLVKQIFPGGRMVAVYRGTVDERGAVSAVSNNPMGLSVTVAGSIAAGRFTGTIDRPRCSFSVDLSRQ